MTTSCAAGERILNSAAQLFCCFILRLDVLRLHEFFAELWEIDVETTMVLRKKLNKLF